MLDDWTNFWGSQPAIKRLRQRGELTIYTAPAAGDDEVMQRLADATVALARNSASERRALNNPQLNTGMFTFTPTAPKWPEIAS